MATRRSGFWPFAALLPELENILERRPEFERNPERQFERRRIFSGFDGDDGLPRRPDAIGQLRLGEPGLEPELANGIDDLAFGALSHA